MKFWRLVTPTIAAALIAACVAEEEPELSFDERYAIELGELNEAAESVCMGRPFTGKMPPMDYAMKVGQMTARATQKVQGKLICDK